MNPIPRQRVTSSNLRSVGYFARTLDVEFVSGAVWRYTDVPPAWFVELLAAGSVGTYFARRIKPVCKAERLDVPATR